MKHKITIIAMAAMLSFIVISFQTFLFGLNPVKIGYNRYDFPAFTIFSKQNAGDIHKDYLRTDEILKENEKTHGLPYREKVNVVICESYLELNLYLPFVGCGNLKNACGFGFWPNTVYISPALKERYTSPLGTLKHELSHILLIQNYGVRNATILWNENEWIPEGFAAYSTGFPHYYGKHELSRKLKEMGIDYASDSNTISAGRTIGSIGLPDRFMLYKCFFEYLAARYGKDKIVSYVKLCFADPVNARLNFRSVYGFEFHQALIDYGVWLSYY